MIALLVTGLMTCSSCAMPSDPKSGADPQFSGSEGALRAGALIFNGASSWWPEVSSISRNLQEHGVKYVQVDTARLEEMSVAEIAAYDLLIVPGGDATAMNASMSKASRARIREAVQEKGVNYLGFCAGAWLAVGPKPAEGDDEIGGYGLRLWDAPVLEIASLAKQGSSHAVSPAVFADGTRRELLWYGGPSTPNIAGGVVARFSDGSPAITQMRSGAGFVMISGLHPTATTSLLKSLGYSQWEAVAPELTWKMLEAALRARPLPAF